MSDRIADRAFEDISSAAGLGPPAGKVEIRGQDPVLPTRFPIGEAAAAALAAGGRAAADLWALQTDQRQDVAVDVRAAASSLLSCFHLWVDGTWALGERAANPTTGLYPAKDGQWVHLHGGFPNLAAGTLEVLGCADGKEAIAEAVAGWDAQALEHALADAKMCGARVREASEWADHPQGRAVAVLPVVEILRIGDADPEPLRPAKTPLGGTRVLDLTRVLAGPTCARTLASFGADALRISSPNLPSIPPFVIDTGHGKRAAFVDLDTSDGVETLRELSRTADVFSQGYRAGALDRRGFGPEHLAALRPGIVYVSMNCYGPVGPWSERPGWEQLSQTVTGIAAAHGRPGAPALLPAAACDYTTGYLAAFGAMVALHRRATVGGSWWVRASLVQTGMWLQRLGQAHALDPAAADPPDADAIAAMCEETVGPHGRVRHLRPAVALSRTPVGWEHPGVPLGHDAPVWR